MSRVLLTCLFLTFSLFIKVNSDLNSPKTFESGLVSTEYVDSKVLFITSSDGKVYAYDMEKHSLKWMIETDLTLQQWTYNPEYKLGENDFMVMPDYNGKMQAFSPSEGFQDFGKADLEQALHVCFSPGKIKYFSKVQESFLVIDLNRGMFWKLEDAYENIDSSRLDSYGVLKIRQYRYNAIDFQSMKEMWSLRTSDLDFYTYFQFLNHGNIPNPSKLLQNYKLVCKGGNTIEVLRARDETFLRSIETESEVISVHSLDLNSSGFFSLKIESEGTMASSQDEFTETQLMVYNQNYHRQQSYNSDSHELAVFNGGKESRMSFNFSTSQGIQIKQDPGSIFSCIKEEIDRKHAIQLFNTSLFENSTVMTYDYENEDRLNNYNNPYVLASTLGCMGLTAILSLVIERRRNKKQKKSVSISTETETKTSGVSVDETGSTGGSSSSRTKEMRAKSGEEPSKEKKKKKKREFEVFTKEILGHGSHGTMVFQGEFQGKSVAVKRFLKCYLEMARMEIDLLMATEHPNIIRYYLYEEDNEFIYLILERCLCSMRNFIDHFKKGKENEADVVSSTKDIVNYKQAIRRAYREKVITPETVRKFSLEIAKGLQYLHRLGIVHRDIKPENILLSLNLDAKLADFGISRILKPEEENFLTEAGSSGWKAPEMLKKTDLKSKSVDIFSLGCTFYYLHTKGEHPFGERHERDGNILANRPQMTYLEDMALEHLIKCMIKHNPEERYTIDDVLAHPYFWEEGKKLAFIQEVSDFVESTDARLGRMLEDYCQNKGAIPIPWNKTLDQSLVRDLTSFRFYDFKSVKELLRVIRNKKNHYYELSEDTKEVLGKMPAGVWNYFNDRFPRLFMNVYIFCQEKNVELSHLL